MTPDPRVGLTAAARIHRLLVPTPFAIGDVNAYLIEDEPLTLVDSGPASTESLRALEVQLRALGYSIADIGLLLVTHQHADHLGLTSYLAAKSGAEVACLDILAEYATAFWERARADDDFAAELMFRHGVPADTVAITQRVASIARNWGADFETTRFLRASSTIELRDRSLRVIHAPGHSPTDTLFFDEMHGVLFSGDHLLAGTSSSALASLPAEANGARCQRSHRQGLVEYIDSLRVTRELNASVVLGGHGGPFSEHRALIDSRLAHYEAQAEVILSLVREQPRTAYQIAKVIWGNVAVTQAFFTLSQVLGHIDVLTIDGLIAEQPHSSESIIYMAV